MKMLRKSRLSVILAIALVFSFSCANYSDWEKPEKVKLTSRDAVYQVPLGTGTVTLSDHLNAAEIHEKLSDALSEDDESESDAKDDSDNALGNLAVYDYNPGGNDTVQEFLINYALPEIPLDFGEYLKNLNLAETINDGLTQTFSVPQLDGLSFDKAIDFPNINDIIAKNFTGSGAGGATLPVPEGQEGSLSNLPSLAMDISPSFSQMDFSAGTLVVTVTPKTTVSASFSLFLTAYLENGLGATLPSTSDNVAQGGTLTIDLAGQSLSSNLAVSFSAEVSGGTFGKIDTYDVSVSLQNTTITRIVDITLDDPDTCTISVSQTNEFGAAKEYLQSATIQTGALALSCALPDGWTGIKTTPTIAVTGGLALSSSELVDGGDTTHYLLNKTADLAQKSLVPANPLVLDGSITFSLENATLTFYTDPTLNLHCQATLGALGPATLILEKLIAEDKLNRQVEKEIADSVLTYIKEAVVTELGISGTMETTLDTSELNVSFVATSTAFNITAADPLQAIANVINDEEGINLYKCAKSDCENGHEKNWTGTTFVPANLPTNANDKHIIDFDLAINIKGAKSGNTYKDYIEVNTIELGKEYSIAAKLDLDFDWERIVLNTGSEGITTSGEIDTGLDINELVSNFLEGNDNADEIRSIIDKIKFAGIEAYMYVARPTGTEDLLGNLKAFSGKVKAMYGDEAAPTEKYILGSDTTAETMTVVEAIDFDSLIDSEETRMITADLFSNAASYSAKTVEGSLCDILNAKPAALKFGYDIGVSGTNSDIALTKDQLGDITNGDSSSAMAITMTITIRLPLELCIGEIEYEEDGTTPKLNADGTPKVSGIAIDDVMTFFGHPLEDDLLSRDDPSTGEESDLSENINKVANMISYVKCGYKLYNTIGLGIQAAFTATNAEGKTYLQKSIVVDTDPMSDMRTFELSAGEIEEILKAENYPFIPAVNLVIAPSAATFENGVPVLTPIKVPRTAAFYANAVVEVKTDGSYEYEF